MSRKIAENRSTSAYAKELDAALGGALLEAVDVAGPWTNVTNVLSPMLVQPSSAQKFYRLSQ